MTMDEKEEMRLPHMLPPSPTNSGGWGTASERDALHRSRMQIGAEGITFDNLPASVIDAKMGAFVTLMSRSPKVYVKGDAHDREGNAVVLRSFKEASRLSVTTDVMHVLVDGEWVAISPELGIWESVLFTP